MALVTGFIKKYCGCLTMTATFLEWCLEDGELSQWWLAQSSGSLYHVTRGQFLYAIRFKTHLSACFPLDRNMVQNYAHISTEIILAFYIFINQLANVNFLQTIKPL